MNKVFKTILIISIAVFGAGFLLIPSTSAQAQDLEVVFENEPNPLFDEANFLPGESITRYVDVTNNSGETKKIGLEIINQYPCSGDCLSDVLDLVINENGSNLYLGSLTTFYGAGEKALSDLSAGATTRYYFSMTFNPIAGNVYQNSTANFDIKIGFFGEESISPEITTGGGGGGGVFIAGLIISDERVDDVGTTDVTIIWNTNKKATSRVIYSPYNLPHLLKPNEPPNYGYSYSTPEYDTPANLHGVTGSHTVHITGLLMGTTYYFRCISHTSPDETITIEHTFITKGVAGTETEKEEEGEEEEEEEEEEEIVEEGGPVSEEGIGEEKEEEEEEEEEEIVIGEEKEGEGEKGISRFLATIGSFFSTLNLCWILFGLIVILLVLSFLSILSIKEKEERKKRWILPLITILLIVLYCFFCCSRCYIFNPDYCYIICFILIVLLILFIFSRQRKKKISENQ